MSQHGNYKKSYIPDICLGLLAVCFLFYALYAAGNPAQHGGWHDPPFVDGLFQAASGLCISTFAGFIARQAWRMQAVEFYHWYRKQTQPALWLPAWWRRWLHAKQRGTPDRATLWIVRIGLTFFTLAGLLLASMGFSVILGVYQP